MVGVWLVMLLLAAVEVPILFRGKLWGELLVFLGLWIIAVVYASLVAVRTAIPSLVHILMQVFSTGSF